MNVTKDKSKHTYLFQGEIRVTIVVANRRAINHEISNYLISHI